MSRNCRPTFAPFPAVACGVQPPTTLAAAAAMDAFFISGVHHFYDFRPPASPLTFTFDRLAAVACRLSTLMSPGAELSYERYSKPHVIEKKKSPRAASNASR